MSLGLKEKSRPAVQAPEFHLAKARPLHTPGLPGGRSSHPYQLDVCAGPSAGLQGPWDDQHRLLLSQSSQSRWGETTHTHEGGRFPAAQSWGGEAADTPCSQTWFRGEEGRALE